jgi:hypothetical protein
LPPAAQTSSEDPPYFRRQAQSHRTVVRGSVSTTRVMEHRHGLPVDIEVTEANGFAERDAALTMLDRLPRRQRRTLAADKPYDVAEFMAGARCPQGEHIGSGRGLRVGRSHRSHAVGAAQAEWLVAHSHNAPALTALPPHTITTMFSHRSSGG